MSYIDKFHTPGTPTTTIIVAASGGDYTTIKEALIYAVANATASNNYKVFIKNGTYNEIQMEGGDWVTVEGESREGVIVVSDGLRTDVDPISGQRYVDMAQSAKRGFASEHYMTYKNLTIRVNDVKYCIHIDEGTVCYQKMVNCLFQHSNGYPIGCGAGYGQILEFEGCTFEKLGTAVANGVGGSHGVYWHNRNDQPSATRLIVNNCNSVNCGLLLLLELGSEQSDLVKTVNCSSGESRGIREEAAAAYWDGGGHDVLDVPYSIRILTVDSPVTLDFDASTRPNGALYAYQV